jgi:hypothetical protein
LLAVPWPKVLESALAAAALAVTGLQLGSASGAHWAQSEVSERKLVLMVVESPSSPDLAVAERPAAARGLALASEWKLVREYGAVVGRVGLCWGSDRGD